MKKVFIYLLSVVVAITMFSFNVISQSKTLEFNQVKLIGSTQDVVPSGKVWKVESVMSKTPVDFKEGYKIQVNGADVYLNTYNSGPKFWSNIVSIKIEAKTKLSCTGTWEPHFVFSGFDGGFPVSSKDITLPSFSQISSWTTIGTITPSVANTSLEISSMSLYCKNTGTSYSWSPWSMRVTFTYSDGTSHQSPQYDFELSTTSCTNWSAGSGVYVIGSSASAPYVVNATSRDHYILPTQLPMWLPAGTTLNTAGNNISYISVVEFNVVP